jgi:hypothetical protein
VSPGRKLKRQQAKGRKMVATAQSRSARQAKERGMPKKPKPEPKVDVPKKPYQRTPEEDEAKDRVLARLDGRPTLPKLVLKEVRDGRKQPALAHDDPVTARLLLMDALGIADYSFLHGYLDQIVKAAMIGKPANPEEANAMLGAIALMRPRDEGEAMLLAQMVSTHNLAMTFARRLALVENIPQQDSASNALTKLTRTYAAQMAALKHYRTGGEQRVIVQRVDVREGGQAVVGVVNSGRGGEDLERNGGKSHAKQIGDARGAALLCDVETEREGVPSAGGAGAPNLPDARRD